MSAPATSGPRRSIGGGGFTTDPSNSYVDKSPQVPFERATRADDGIATRDEFYHVTLANQTSWALSLLPLALDDDLFARRIAATQGNLALRATPSSNDPSPSPLHSLRLDLFPRIFQHVDLNEESCFEIYSIVEGPRTVCKFLPAQVEVRRQFARVSYWPGLEEARSEATRRAHHSGGSGSRVLGAGACSGSGLAPLMGLPAEGHPSGSCGSGEEDIMCGGTDFEEPLPHWLVAMRRTLQFAECRGPKFPTPFPPKKTQPLEQAHIQCAQAGPR